MLVVEDDPHLAAGLAENLRAEGYADALAADGGLALTGCASMPASSSCSMSCCRDLDGFTLCRTLRARATTPRCSFSLRAAIRRIACCGLEAGGDDYLAKPFHLEEFLLRVRAILRRWEWYRKASATAGERGAALRRQ